MEGVEAFWNLSMKKLTPLLKNGEFSGFARHSGVQFQDAAPSNGNLLKNVISATFIHDRLRAFCDTLKLVTYGYT